MAYPLLSTFIFFLSTFLTKMVTLLFNEVPALLPKSEMSVHLPLQFQYLYLAMSIQNKKI